VNNAVVVIGAGSAGLAAASALQRRGIDVIVLERGPSVAMSWRTRHDRLRLNTVRQTSGLPAFRIPRTAGRWVARDAYVAYLEEFASARRVDVRSGVDVVRVDVGHDDGDRWLVHTASETIPTSHVIVATGHDRIPWTPTWPGTSDFAPSVRHVAEVVRPADFSGQRVLIVGGGNSGIDMAGHLLDAGVGELWLSSRTPPNILPGELHHVPLQLVALAGRGLPERVRDGLARAFQRYAFGDLAAYGLPAPANGPYRHLRETGVTVAIDQGFVAHLKAGRARVVAEVDHLDRSEVVLRDGTRLRPDVVLAATGYRTGLAPIVGHLGVLDAHGRPRAVAGTRSDPPGLHFIGFRPAIEGNLRQHPGEARRITRLIRANLR